MKMDNTRLLDQIVLQVAHKLRELATRQGVVPFLTGDLRKSIQASLVGIGRAVVGSNLSYARAVHDGRPAITIRPRNKKALFWGPRTIGGRSFAGAPHPMREVHQKARKAKPFFLWAARDMKKEGFGFLYPLLRDHYGEELARNLPGKITIRIG